MRILQLAVVAAFFAVPAAAQPPQQGAAAAFHAPSILCDTSEQLQSILAAFGDGVDSGTARFAELYRTPNDRNEPTCAITGVRTALTTGATALGLVDLAGAEFYGWIVRIENPAGEGYFLYLESPAEALKNSI